MESYKVLWCKKTVLATEKEATEKILYTTLPKETRIIHITLSNCPTLVRYCLKRETALLESFGMTDSFLKAQREDNFQAIVLPNNSVVAVFLTVLFSKLRFFFSEIVPVKGEKDEQKKYAVVKEINTTLMKLVAMADDITVDTRPLKDKYKELNEEV